MPHVCSIIFIERQPSTSTPFTEEEMPQQTDTRPGSLRQLGMLLGLDARPPIMFSHFGDTIGTYAPPPSIDELFRAAVVVAIIGTAGGFDSVDDISDSLCQDCPLRAICGI